MPINMLYACYSLHLGWDEVDSNADNVLEVILSESVHER